MVDIKKILNSPNTHIMAINYFYNGPEDFFGLAYSIQSNITKEYYLLLIKMNLPSKDKLFFSTHPKDFYNNLEDNVRLYMAKPDIPKVSKLYGPTTPEFLANSKSVGYINL